MPFLERRPLDFLPFLKEVVKLLERTVVESVTIEVAYQAGQFVVNADPTRMQQMIMNLALNARDAMPRGGRLQFALAEVWVNGPNDAPLAEIPPGPWVHFSVTDEGNGIPTEVLPHIFDPFFTTKGAGQGTGLGLAQVWGIVKQHDGYIDVASHPGAGTTFSIYLPAHIPEKNIPSRPADAALKFGSQEKILVVEDDPVARQALVDSLVAMNYQVRTAKNGREGLDILVADPADISLLISDVIMPEMGGIQLIHELRELGLVTHAILLTGHSHATELDQFLADPSVEWLPKPVSLEQLVSVVTSMLAGV